MSKRYVLNIDDRQWSVQVARNGHQTRVQIEDQEPLILDARVVLGGKALSLRLGDRQHLVHLTGLDCKGSLAATSGGLPLRLNVMDELKAQALDSLGTGGGGTIIADIPGLVVELKVKPGQIVHQGEPVIVVEAMKMQNELAAGVTGAVKEVPVAVGQTVNPGDPLVVIEPEPGV